ncbi:unnamed protein product [Toxocara canis]|uniref:WAP domain-containing protein n=1 Tax=Toxocara canis TaxID=6265 RepID=A0A183V3U2_TOXCA|nr:unnamed protein product [Toxocara canis]
MLCTVALFVVFGAAISGDVESAVHEVTSTKDGATWCPVALVGTQCPSSSIFHFYKCCGTANKDCCFNLQANHVGNRRACRYSSHHVGLFCAFGAALSLLSPLNVVWIIDPTICDKSYRLGSQDIGSPIPLHFIVALRSGDTRSFCVDDSVCGSLAVENMFETVTIFLVFDGDKRCPIGVIGPVKCPDSNPFYYYKCCGAAGMDCCFKLQVSHYAMINCFNGE